MQTTRSNALLLQGFQFAIGIQLSVEHDEEIDADDAVICIILIKGDCLGVIILGKFQLTTLLLHTATCCISRCTIRILLYQIVDAIIRLGIVLVLIIQQRQPELCLEVTRHQNQKVLIIKTGKVIAQKLFVN